MLSNSRKLCIFILVLFVVSCSKSTAHPPTLPTASTTPLPPGGSGNVERTLLRFEDLMKGFDFIIDDSGGCRPIRQVILEMLEGLHDPGKSCRQKHG